jgi:hypothetical protein
MVGRAPGQYQGAQPGSVRSPIRRRLPTSPVHDPTGIHPNAD